MVYSCGCYREEYMQANKKNALEQHLENKKKWQKVGSQISNAKVTAERKAKKAERNALILEYHKQGYSTRDIAKKVGCSDKTVRNVLKEG